MLHGALDGEHDLPNEIVAMEVDLRVRVEVLQVVDSFIEVVDERLDVACMVRALCGHYWSSNSLENIKSQNHSINLQ